MQWVNSAGGPLICVERALAHFWRGVDGITLGHGVQTDYDRACQIKQYLGNIELEKGAALILGDMPLETSIWRNSLGQTLIVRLQYIDKGADIPMILSSLDESSFYDAEEAINFTFESGDIVIFDSAIPGADDKKRVITFATPPTRYRITTHRISPNDRAEFLLHRFCSIE